MGQECNTIQLRSGAQLVAHGNDFYRAHLAGCYLVWCYDYAGETPIRIDMENNYWDYLNAGLIDNYVWDYNDDPSLMMDIDFEPFANSSVPTKKESLGDLKALFLGR